MARLRPILPALLLLLTAACATPGPDPAGFAAALDDASDRRHPEAALWDSLFRQAAGDSGRRLLLARTLGHGSWPALAPSMLQALHGATEPGERVLWLFALGRTAGTGVADGVAPFADDPAPEARRAAVSALGRLPETAASLPALLKALQDPDAEVRGDALLAMTRLRGRRAAEASPLSEEEAGRVREAAASALGSGEPELPWQGAYALANMSLPQRMPLLAAALKSPQATVRMFAARGLGRLDEVEAEPRRALLASLPAQDPDPHVAAAAAEALGRIGGADSVPPLLATLRQRRDRPSDHHARQAAAAALGGLAPGVDAAAEQSIRHGLEAALGDPSPRVRAAAGHSLLQRAPASWPEALVGWVASGSRLDRMAAAAAAAAGRSPRALAALTELSRDPDAPVAAAALTALAARPDGCPAFRVRLAEALACSDVAICGAALDGLEKCSGEDDLALVRRAFAAASGPAGVELRLAALTAAARLDADGVAALLSRGLLDEAAAVRLRSAELLSESGHPTQAPRRPGPPSSVPLPSLADPTAPPPRLRLSTDRGVLEIALRPAAAPRHSAMLLARARAGLLDGLGFHRVVSGFVAQGLDPRGDGWGTGDVFLRDEIDPAPYRRGSVGMPNSGADTGGCQIFITHVPTPHLDGNYTILGEVVAGWEVLDALDLGDLVRRVEVVEPR